MRNELRAVRPCLVGFPGILLDFIKLLLILYKLLTI